MPIQPKSQSALAEVKDIPSYKARGLLISSSNHFVVIPFFGGLSCFCFFELEQTQSQWSSCFTLPRIAEYETLHPAPFLSVVSRPCLAMQHKLFFNLQSSCPCPQLFSLQVYIYPAFAFRYAIKFRVLIVYFFITQEKNLNTNCLSHRLLNGNPLPFTMLSQLGFFQALT